MKIFSNVIWAKICDSLQYCFSPVLECIWENQYFIITYKIMSVYLSTYLKWAMTGSMVTSYIVNVWDWPISILLCLLATHHSQCSCLVQYLHQPSSNVSFISGSVDIILGANIHFKVVGLKHFKKIILVTCWWKAINHWSIFWNSSLKSYPFVLMGFLVWKTEMFGACISSVWTVSG